MTAVHRWNARGRAPVPSYPVPHATPRPRSTPCAQPAGPPSPPSPPWPSPPVPRPTTPAVRRRDGRLAGHRQGRRPDDRHGRTRVRALVQRRRPDERRGLRVGGRVRRGRAARLRQGGRRVAERAASTRRSRRGPRPSTSTSTRCRSATSARKAVDFSSPYYDVRQAVVALEDSPAAKATSIADLKDAAASAPRSAPPASSRRGEIDPTPPRRVNDNDQAKSALKNGQVDAIVVDLPTAFYITAAEVTTAGSSASSRTRAARRAVRARARQGQRPHVRVTTAVDALREDGTLARSRRSGSPTPSTPRCSSDA